MTTYRFRKKNNHPIKNTTKGAAAMCHDNMFVAKNGYTIQVTFVTSEERLIESPFANTLTPTPPPPSQPHPISPHSSPVSSSHYDRYTTDDPLRDARRICESLHEL